MKKYHFSARKTHWMAGLMLASLLAGCVGYVDGPPRAAVYVEPPLVPIETGVIVQDDYVYYPGYQVYYSSNRGRYIYRDGRSWVTRDRPPRVSADVLRSAPSVRLDFHDSPAGHHAAVVRQYPKRWQPPGGNPNRRPDGGNNPGNRR